MKLNGIREPNLKAALIHCKTLCNLDYPSITIRYKTMLQLHNVLVTSEED